MGSNQFSLYRPRWMEWVMDLILITGMIMSACFMFLDGMPGRLGMELSVIALPVLALTVYTRALVLRYNGRRYRAALIHLGCKWRTAYPLWLVILRAGMVLSAILLCAAIRLERDSLWYGAALVLLLPPLSWFVLPRLSVITKDC